jgi:competence CoiA-like predicted nuclease
MGNKISPDIADSSTKYFCSECKSQLCFIPKSGKKRAYFAHINI